MFYRLALCLLISSAVFSQNLGHDLKSHRGKNFKGTRRILGGKPFIQTPHQSVVDGKLDKKKMIEAVFQIDNSDLCGGTIIGDRFILTAAHCFVPGSLCSGADESTVKQSIPPPSKITVYIEGTCHTYGKKTCPDNEAARLVAAKTIYILEEYYTKNKCTSGDLAIIELAEIIGDHGAKLFDSIELPTSGDFILSGFGQDPENTADTGHTLKSVNLTAQKCDVEKLKNNVQYDSICTVEIDKDACAGDSGGALVTKDDVIIGIVSGGTPCEDMYTSVLNQQSEDEPLTAHPGGVFTSVSMHYGFICDIVGSLQGCPKTFNKEPYLTIS